MEKKPTTTEIGEDFEAPEEFETTEEMGTDPEETTEEIGRDRKRPRASRFSRRYESEKTGGILGDLAHALSPLITQHTPGNPHRIQQLTESVNNMRQLIKSPGSVPPDYIRNVIKPDLAKTVGELATEQQGTTDLKVNTPGIISDVAAVGAGLAGYARGVAKGRMEEVRKLIRKR